MEMVDDILMTGAREELECFRKRFDDVYVLGSTSYDPEHLGYSVLNTIQNANMCVAA